MKKSLMVAGWLVAMLGIQVASAAAQNEKQPPLSLSLQEAIDRGLRHNLNVLLNEQASRFQEGKRWETLKDVLPNVSMFVGQTREMLNPAAFGFDMPVIGPFNVFEARVVASQPLLNLEALYKARSYGAMANAETHAYKDARDLVVLAVVNLYLQTVASAGRLETAQAQLRNAALVVADRDQAGGFGALAALSPMQAGRQQLIALENSHLKHKLTLARVIGLPHGQEFTLSDQIPYAAMRPIALEEAAQQAYLSREDFQAQLTRVQAAETKRKAEEKGRLPSVWLEANYGTVGPSRNTAATTFGVMGLVRVPFFDGGEHHGKILQADAELKQEQAKLEDLRDSIYYEVQTALLDLQAADAQMQVARAAASLVTTGGSTGTDQAQEGAATTTDNYIATLYAFNLAKLNFARAVGSTESAFKELLGTGR